MFTTENYLSNPDLVGFPKLGINFDISSTAFSVFGFDIKWYGICIALGMLLAILYCLKRMKEFGLDSDRVMDVVLIGIIGAILGARAYYIIFDEGLTFADYFKFRSGGMAVYGGLISALIIAAVVGKIRKVKILPLFDIASIGFLIGQGIGRWGNFFNKEAFGDVTQLPWGMSSASVQYVLGNFSGDLAMAHPCFLYEFLWCLIGFIFLNIYYKKRKFDGEIFLMYCTWYGLGRFIIEGLRTDSLYIGLIRVSQLVSGIIFVVALFLLIFFRLKVKRNPRDFVLYKDTDESKELLKEAEEKLKKYEEEKKNKKLNIKSNPLNTEDKKTLENDKIGEQEDDKKINTSEVKDDGKDN